MTTQQNGRNDMKEHISEDISAVIGRSHDDPALDRYDWTGYWPVVDDRLRVTDVLDSEHSGDYVLADVREGKLVAYDGASDVLITQEVQNG
jgi:hypothetical protein